VPPPKEAIKIISRQFLAKYPFTSEAQKCLQDLNLHLEDLLDPCYRPVLERGRERVLEALDEGVVSCRMERPDVEFLSFPVARLIVEAVRDNFLKHRFATAESKRAQKLFEEEGEETLLVIARKTFNVDVEWVREEVDGRVYHFKVHFSDYLRYASSFHDPYWKLVNRLLLKGYVYLVKDDFARLLSGAVEKKLSESRGAPAKLPPEIRVIVDEVSLKAASRRGRYAFEDVKGTVVEEAFPPCIASIISALRSNKPLSHSARFTLTSFLLHVGYPVDKIVSLFSGVPDFREDLTRYQVEHIAGMKSGTRYTPPKCETLKTYGLCPLPEGCGNVRHPLEYYRRHRRERLASKGVVENERKGEDRVLP